MKATDKQLQYIYSLAQQAGATDGRRWLLSHIGASMSARANNCLTRAMASEIIDALTSGTIEMGEPA